MRLFIIYFFMPVFSMTFMELSHSSDYIIPDETLSKFQKLTGITEVIQKTKSDCKNGNQMPSPEYMVDSNPNYFGGINPNSPKWKDVQKIYKEFEARSCEYLDIEILSKKYTLALLNEYNEIEIEELDKFLSSDFGVKFIKSGIKANSAMQKELSDSLATVSVESIKWYESELQKLISK
jgi:hypothetical protein